MLYTGADLAFGRWLPVIPESYERCRKYDSKEAAQAEAVAISMRESRLDWVRVIKLRRPPEAGLRWGVQNRRRGRWRFHHDPTVRDGWDWRIEDATVKILTFATKADAEGWLTMYRMATGEGGRVVAVPLDMARREWGPK